MKRIFLFFLIICLLFSVCSCTKEKASIADYQYMYEGITKDWNKAATPGHERDSLLGYGEYLYNSYLILFPKETPASLEDFYFHWTQGIDTDGYAIYFTCHLNEENYHLFAEGLNNFKLYNGEECIIPLFDDSHFSLPAYILQWSNVGEKWEVLEYIMLDEVNHTAIFVYTMSELDFIEKQAAYTITPSELDFLTADFSIYRDFENSTYDISFLDYLNCCNPA